MASTINDSTSQPASADISTRTLQHQDYDSRRFLRGLSGMRKAGLLLFVQEACLERPQSYAAYGRFREI